MDRVFLDFEKPIEEILQQLDDVERIGTQQGVDTSQIKNELNGKLEATTIAIFKDLSPWQKVQLSRHPNRPYTNHYIKTLCSSFSELKGDRNIGDDKAIVGGFGLIENQTFMIIGHQKGHNTKTRQYRNFGMANPEGYRKALRLMKLAEKFNKPIITLIDTPGAYPGLEAEERGQGEAIARNIYEMVNIQVPIICVIIGEGASGGALGIGVGDKTLMLENTWYSVISPESCSSILWRSWEHKEKAADALKLTAPDMLGNGLIDQIVPEPIGGAHAKPYEMSDLLKHAILKNMADLQEQTADERVENRINKYTSIGHFIETGSKKKATS